MIVIIKRIVTIVILICFFYCSRNKKEPEDRIIYKITNISDTSFNKIKIPVYLVDTLMQPFLEQMIIEEKKCEYYDSLTGFFIEQNDSSNFSRFCIYSSGNTIWEARLPKSPGVFIFENHRFAFDTNDNFSWMIRETGDSIQIEAIEIKNQPVIIDDNLSLWSFTFHKNESVIEINYKSNCRL